MSSHQGMPTLNRSDLNFYQKLLFRRTLIIWGKKKKYFLPESLVSVLLASASAPSSPSLTTSPPRWSLLAILGTQPFLVLRVLQHSHCTRSTPHLQAFSQWFTFTKRGKHFFSYAKEKSLCVGCCGCSSAAAGRW